MSHIDASELKEYVISNNLTQKILLDIGCHDIREYGKEWRAALPNKTNKTALAVYKDMLSIAIRTSEGNTYGDIFTLVMKLKNISFGKANKYIHKLLGLKYSYTKNNTENSILGADNNNKDPLYLFKKIRRESHVGHMFNKDIPIYDNSILEEYSSLPYIGWIREGIMPNAFERFNIKYSYDKRRIVIPERKWDGDENEYIGVCGRTTIPDYEILGIPKYFKLSKTYPKGFNLYGLNENYQTIQEARITVVMEAPKSVLKRYSRNDGTAVAIGNCEITQEQAKILIGLNVEICICLDEGISLQHIRKMCERFYRIRKVSYMYDRWGLIKQGSKDSPADMHNKIYNFMLKHRTLYTEQEHQLYLQGSEEKINGKKNTARN